ncbi:HNH endonuclease [Schauerella aestuarii]|uniref:HNH endonuclease n=1 Tax=Schauerella aestuarii TaxID=2511204 RepID=UPI0038B3A8AE
MNRDGWICQTCKRKGRVAEATQCDHIVPVSKQGDDSPSNLEAICDACHEAKTQREAGNTGKLRARISVEGWPESV